MLLASLAKLAEREGWIEIPGYAKDLVDLEIVLDKQGHVVGLVDLEQENGRGLKMRVPTIPKRTVGVDAGLLVDKSMYVLGVYPLDDKNVVRAAERSERCRLSFVARLVALGAGDLGLVAVNKFYSHFSASLEVLFNLRPRESWDGKEKLVFRLEHGGYVHDSEEVARHLITAQGNAADNAQMCLVRGSMGNLARLHPLIKRVPGSLVGGASLVAFNKDPFKSHGLEQGDNAPISSQAAEAYGVALNALLAKPEGSKRPHQYGVRLSDDTVVVYWSDAPLGKIDFFAELFESTTPEAVGAVLSSAWLGRVPDELDTSSFYALTLSGNSARVVVRNWFESNLGQVKANLKQYFQDMQIGNTVGSMAVYHLIKAIDPPGNAAPPPDIAQKLFLSSLTGAPLPRELLRHALLRLRAEKDAGPKELQTRYGIIKAVLCSHGRRAGNKHQEVTVSLDDSNSSASYVLGRLFAALERAQSNALGETNASIRDRYFGAASSAPVTVFPRLLRMAQHHISKAKADNHDYGIERVIANVVGKLSAKPFPSVMNLEEQGLFAIGYYHQREAFYVKKAD